MELLGPVWIADVTFVIWIPKADAITDAGGHTLGFTVCVLARLLDPCCAAAGILAPMTHRAAPAAKEAASRRRARWGCSCICGFIQGILGKARGNGGESGLGRSTSSQPRHNCRPNSWQLRRRFTWRLKPHRTGERSGRSGMSTNDVALRHVRTGRPPRGLCNGGHPSPQASPRRGQRRMQQSGASRSAQ